MFSSSGWLAPDELGHVEKIDILTIDLESMSPDALAFKAQLIVEGDGWMIADIDHELESVKLSRTCPLL